MAVKNFDAWLKNKKFINLNTKKQSEFESLPEKQKQKIKDQHQEYNNQIQILMSNKTKKII